ncbi:MAG TPA: mannose-6-phosphate isomerase, class I [Termitinemataceae bacterium]|nr:mannose-6-phosphate isomerase, class I [Termitinemataceae bacterium]HOM22638.1 mannose-6-phosphate isomerase, class I [Termitinemataceae bacterium]HPP99477.1 mannose-6-phosphate isomerase, class I [Termitinemataceae bacterium]
MEPLLLLQNQIQTYSWGSRFWIPQMLRLPIPSDTPMAELWMGAHPKAPSLAITRTQGAVPLNQLIGENPEWYLGKELAKEGTTLPFLFKLLAAELPLSIQVHPSKAQAEEGFARENQEGIPLDAANRNYKDNNHKPEIIAALTPFRALCGFRQEEEITTLFSWLEMPPLLPAIKALQERKSYIAFLQALFTISPEIVQDILRELHTRTLPFLVQKAPTYQKEWETIRSFINLYPQDITVLAPLYLNLIDLEVGQALFLPAGILHAYVHGFGVELMANSDNVLRGGLTTKHMDPTELLRILENRSYVPSLLSPVPIGPDKATGPDKGSLLLYPSEAKEFRLGLVSGHLDGTKLPGGLPFIICVVEGTIELKSGGETLLLHQGEAAFVAASAQNPNVTGNGKAFFAIPNRERS